MLKTNKNVFRDSNASGFFSTGAETSGYSFSDHIILGCLLYLLVQHSWILLLHQLLTHKHAHGNNNRQHMLIACGHFSNAHTCTHASMQAKSQTHRFSKCVCLPVCLWQGKVLDSTHWTAMEEQDAPPAVVASSEPPPAAPAAHAPKVTHRGRVSTPVASSNEDAEDMPEYEYFVAAGPRGFPSLAGECGGAAAAAAGQHRCTHHKRDSHVSRWNPWRR